MAGVSTFLKILPRRKVPFLLRTTHEYGINGRWGQVGFCLVNDDCRRMILFLQVCISEACRCFRGGLKDAFGDRLT